MWGQPPTSSAPCRWMRPTERPCSRPMRWLCFLLASAAATAGAVAQTAPAKTLRFDLAAIPATRDSFLFFLRGAPRGYAVWPYETPALGMSQEVLYTAHYEFKPIQEEPLPVVLER